MTVSTILRTNNVAEYQQVDAVIIDERKPPGSIQAIAGNKVCVVGEFQRGPVDVVTAIGSTRDLVNKFGTVGPDSNGAFYKGMLSLVGKRFGRLYVVRVSNVSQVTATVTIDDGAGSPTNVIRFDAESPGAWGNNLKVTVAAASSGVATEFDLTVKYEGETVEIHRGLDLADFAVSDDLTPGSVYIRTIKLAQGDGLPDTTIVDQALSTGADGIFSDADYTGSVSDVRGIELLKGSQHSDIRWVYAAENTAAGVNAALLNLAAATKTKNALINGAKANTVAQAVTDVANYRSDRVGYCFPWAKVFVAEANGGKGGLVDVQTNSFAAATLAALAPGENPAGVNGEPYMTGIRELTNPNLATADYITLREQGIMGFQKTQERQVFGIRSGITTSLDPALKNWARRTMADFLQESIAVFLATFQNKRITLQNKQEVKAAITDFLDQQILFGILPSKADLNSNVAPGSPTLLPYEVDIDSLNTPATEANGIFVVLLRVRIHPTMDFIVLRTEIGERVEVSEAA